MAAIHKIHKDEDAVLVFPECIEALIKELSEFLEMFGIYSAENLNILSRKLEWYASFDFDAFSRRVADEEAIIDMPQRTISTNHDVPVMAILDLKQVGHQAVGS